MFYVIVFYTIKNINLKSNFIMKTFVLLILSLVLSSQAFSLPNDTLSRNPGDFHALVVFGNIKVKMVKSDSTFLTMSSGNYDVNKVITKVEKGVLTLRSNAIGDSKEVFVTLYFKTLDNIKVDAGANVVQTDTIASPSLTIKIVKGSLMRALVETENLTVTATQGSEIRLAGTAKNLSVTSNSGAFFDSFALISISADVKANTGGKINLYVKENIKAKAKTGAVINYKGNPKTESVEPVMGGEINKVN